MSYSTITMEESDGIAKLTLNRPDKLNSVDKQMSSELLDALVKVDQNDNVRVIILTGAGRAFCAGVDIKDSFQDRIEAKKAGEEPFNWADWIEKSRLQFKEMSKPMIASINGPAVGLGVTMSLCCDIRIASDEATVSLPFLRVGLTQEYGSSYILTRVIGIAKACELVFSGKTIEASEAKEIGLYNQVLPASELEEATNKLAKSIAQGAPIAMKLAKRALYQGLDTDLRTQLQYERLIYDILLETEDHKEAVSAFFEKRKPVFKGK